MGQLVEPPASGTIHHPLSSEDIDVEAITARYRAERNRRLRADDIAQFKPTKGVFSRFKDDVDPTPIERDPIHSETKVLIVGAGFSGLVTAVKLKEQGIHDFLIVDRAAGFGGTWYWNQYPGAACDVESSIYLPLLEETGYAPRERFPSGAEIREHVARIVSQWDLAPHAHLRTDITSVRWDERRRRWLVQTSQSDLFTAQFLVLGTGTFHDPKLPGIPGIEDFGRPHFHTGRWDYGITGGDASGNLVKLADKTVGVIGTGASATQVVPHLARSAKKLLVFQRTPSSITIRENWRSDHAGLASLKPGWQKEMMDRFANILQGDDTSDADCSATEGLDGLSLRTILREARAAGVTVKPEEIPELIQLADFRLMGRLRQLVDDTVLDRDTAERLKPWYSFMCKRPAFNNEYLAAFNRPNVELVDTDGKGVSRLSTRGVIANDREYEVDLLIYATGFDFEIGNDFHRRTGIELRGKEGKTLDETWEAKGLSTLFGIHVRDFPNLFIIGPAQAGVTGNWTHTVYAAGDHIAELVKSISDDGTFEAIEPTAEAQENWGKQVEEGSNMRLQYAQSCPPGYFNKEGKPHEISPRWGYYPKGIVAWEKLLKQWRQEGSLEGMDRI